MPALLETRWMCRWPSASVGGGDPSGSTWDFHSLKKAFFNVFFEYRKDHHHQQIWSYCKYFYFDYMGKHTLSGETYAISSCLTSWLVKERLRKEEEENRREAERLGMPGNTWDELLYIQDSWLFQCINILVARKATKEAREAESARLRCLSIHHGFHGPMVQCYTTMFGWLVLNRVESTKSEETWMKYLGGTDETVEEIDESEKPHRVLEIFWGAAKRGGTSGVIFPDLLCGSQKLLDIWHKLMQVLLLVFIWRLLKAFLESVCTSLWFSRPLFIEALEYWTVTLSPEAKEMARMGRRVEAWAFPCFLQNPNQHKPIQRNARKPRTKANRWLRKAPAQLQLYHLSPPSWSYPRPPTFGGLNLFGGSNL